MLRNRVAIVTGAGSGLGRSHARYLAARGARVIANDIDGDACRATADRISGEGGEAVPFIGDVALRESALAIAEFAFSKFQRIDILVNNAGLLRDKTFAKMDLDDFERVIGVHLLGSTYLCHACWPCMQSQRWGRVVLTTSSSGLWGSFGQTNYAAAKMGLVGLMLSLRLEAEPLGIKVNAIAPFAYTPMAKDVFPEEVRSRMAPEHVSALVTYLCSEECSVNGELFEVGLGRIARVRMKRDNDQLLSNPTSPEQVARTMPILLSELGDRHSDNMYDAFEYMARPID